MNMRKEEWTRRLAAMVERTFSTSYADGMRCPAPLLKMEILSYMFNDEILPMENGKRLAYGELAGAYTAQMARN
jgi:hypothetical protein